MKTFKIFCASGIITLSSLCLLMQWHYSQPQITHLAEKRLSTDFCDWSEVTDGLLWETERQKDRDENRVRCQEQRERKKQWHFLISQHESPIIKI